MNFHLKNNVDNINNEKTIKIEIKIYYLLNFSSFNYPFHKMRNFKLFLPFYNIICVSLFCLFTTVFQNNIANKCVFGCKWVLFVHCQIFFVSFRKKSTALIPLLRLIIDFYPPYVQSLICKTYCTNKLRVFILLNLRDVFYLILRIVLNFRKIIDGIYKFLFLAE